ncbi:MAG: ABC transporter permease, partial [Thiomargarita sp.]|nr:ABC transporter permease [Thiomargarita sp.]
MKLLILLAWRNVWRHSHRTFIILLAISLGVWSMLGISAFMRGMMNQQVNDAINNLVGHIQIHAPYYVDDPVIEHRFQPPNKALLTILNDKTQVQNWSMRIRVPAVINTERESTGITLLGIEPKQEYNLSFIPKAITAGRYLNDIHDTGIILGRKLVERLETRLGKRIVLISQNHKNEIVEQGFRIIGIFDANPEEVEIQFGFIAKQTAQTFLNIQNEISEIALLTQDRNKLANTLQQLKTAAPNLDEPIPLII